MSIKILALPYLYSVYRKFQTSKFSIRNIPPQKISQKNCSHDILVWAERIYHEKKLFWIKILGEENLWLEFSWVELQCTEAPNDTSEQYEHAFR